MKRALLIAASAALALTSTLASAQSYGGRDNYRGGYDNNRYDNNRYDNRGAQRWERGQRLDQRYRSRDRIVSNYRSYRLAPPPRGYNYYRSDNGDIALAAIATGLIASLLSNSNGQYGSSYGSSYGYAQPYAAAPQVYRDQYGRAYTVDPYGQSVWVR